MAEPKLKPCPFCGGEAEMLEKMDKEGRKLVRVRCAMCYAQSPYKANPKYHGWFLYRDKYSAHAAWNWRYEGEAT